MSIIRLFPIAALAAVCLLTPPAHAAPPAAAHHHARAASARKSDDDHKIIAPRRVHNPIMWHDPGDIARKDLLHGSGGQAEEPRPPLTFLGEDHSGSSPKFDVRDANGVKWRVKLGAEARPEVAASRLLWAIGYFTDIDYNVHLATVPHIHLRRGGTHIHHHDEITNARFERKPDGEKRIASWAWKRNPFSGTREFNGLRVMMAVLNSWDLKDVNNAVYEDKKDNRQIFLVSDIGASLGTNSVRIRSRNGKGNVHKYVESKFITRITPETVNFGTPAQPNVVVLETAGLAAPIYFRRSRYVWIGHNIPREDARWIGDLLGRLTPHQLEDAFRAGNFTPEETAKYVDVLEGRIAQLKAL